MNLQTKYAEAFANFSPGLERSDNPGDDDGFAQKIELKWKSFLCDPLRISAISALMGLSTQRAAEIRRGRRENKSDLPLFMQSRRRSQ